MVWRRTAALAAFVAASSPVICMGAALPAPAMQSERLVYSIMVGGLHLGDAMIGLNQTSAGYSTEMKLTARGVAKMVKNFRSDMRGEGRFAEAGAKPMPAVYSRQWSTNAVASDMTMKFDPATGLAMTEERYFNPETSAAIAPEDLPWADKGDKDKPVPADLRTNVLDPMAAFVAARVQIMAQAANGPKTFRVPIYDGRRRYDIVGKAEAPRSSTINGLPQAVIPVTAKLEPVFGFSRKSQERMKDSEGKFLFSNDARFIPLQLVVSNELMSGVLNLAADCSQNAAPCETFGQEKDE